MSKAAPKRPQPNLARSILVHGMLTHPALHTLLPAARQLLDQSREPVTLLVKSGGGSVEALNEFDDVLRATDEQGQACPIITIAQGEARSVAAYLVVLGDVALAQPRSILSFHGIHYGLRRIKQINREEAMAMAIRLDGENRKMARKLAGKVAQRVAVQYLQQTEKPGRKSTKPSSASLRLFIKRICAQLSADKFRALAWQSLVEVEAIHALGRIPATKRTATAEGQIFQTVIADKLRQHRAADWALDEIEGAGILMDYLFWRDALMNGPKAADDSTPSYFPIFGLYAFALCRRLLTGENAIPAQDACLLGLIDEVVTLDPAGA